MFLNVKEFTRNLTPVISPELKTKTGEFDSDGLFSESIFGIEGSIDRSQIFSYILLNTKVIHPAVYILLLRLDKRLKKFFNTEESFSLDINKRLISDDNGFNGIPKFIQIFPNIQFRTETPERQKILQVIRKSYEDNTLFIDKIIVIPPQFRPMYEDQDKNLVIDELNNIYIELIRKAEQIKTVGKQSTLFDLLTFHLQDAVNKHDQFLRSRIAKKHGLIRSSLLGKRVDFSARGVIVPGPDLNMNEIGVPLRMMVALFEPFIIHYVLYSRSYPFRKDLEKEVYDFLNDELSVDTLTRILHSIRNGDKIPESLYKLIFNSTEVVMKGRVVLAKRDPVLHDGSYHAFYPKLINGHVIQMSTLQVGEFNADFDGDQMAIFHPITKEAQEEASKLLQLAGSKNPNHVRFELSKEMIAGLYVITKNKPKTNSPITVSEKMLQIETDPYIQVKYRGRITTFGRALVNSVFPTDFPFIDELMSKKLINSLISKVLNKYGQEVASKVFSKLSKIGFKFATIMAPSITIDLFELPDSILRIKEKLTGASPDEADRLLKEAENLLKQHIKDTGLYDLVESGAGKGWNQPRQILIAKGVIADPKGNVLPPIKGSFADGLKTTEYFEAASGARKGMADRALNTAETGYFSRQLVYLLSPVEASPTLKDCGTTRTITIRLTKDIIKRLYGRYIIYGNRVVEFDPSKFNVGTSISLRTPIFCQSKKICHRCYGDLLLRYRSPYIGISSATSIGERSTQLIMRTFHTGGATSIAQHNVLQEIRENDPLVDVDLKRYLKQEEDKLIVLKDCTLTIDLANYTEGDSIQFNEENIWVSQIVSRLEFDDVIINLVLDYPVEINKLNAEIDRSTVVIQRVKHDIILEIPVSTVEIREQVGYIKRLLGGKVVYLNPSHLVIKILKVYGPVSNLDLVHFEVLVSQVLRDRSNPSLPARLGKKWDPIMMNIKKDVFATGFIQGLAFENVNKAIETGLIQSEAEESILGKLLTGEI